MVKVRGITVGVSDPTGVRASICTMYAKNLDISSAPLYIHPTSPTEYDDCETAAATCYVQHNRRNVYAPAIYHIQPTAEPCVRHDAAAAEQASGQPALSSTCRWQFNKLGCTQYYATLLHSARHQHLPTTTIYPFSRQFKCSSWQISASDIPTHYALT